MKKHNKERHVKHIRLQSALERKQIIVNKESNLFDKIYCAYTDKMKQSKSLVASMWQFTKL